MKDCLKILKDRPSGIDPVSEDDAVAADAVGEAVAAWCRELGMVTSHCVGHLKVKKKK